MRFISKNIPSKFEIVGKNAHQELQKICTANIKSEIGKCTYTQMLNTDGGIETDLTIVCIDKDYFRIIRGKKFFNTLNFLMF